MTKLLSIHGVDGLRSACRNIAKAKRPPSLSAIVYSDGYVSSSSGAAATAAAACGSDALTDISGQRGERVAVWLSEQYIIHSNEPFPDELSRLLKGINDDEISYEELDKTDSMNDWFQEHNPITTKKIEVDLSKPMRSDDEILDRIGKGVNNSNSNDHIKNIVRDSEPLEDYEVVFGKIMAFLKSVIWSLKLLGSKGLLPFNAKLLITRIETLS
jgi:hypothetical protein